MKDLPDPPELMIGVPDEPEIIIGVPASEDVEAGIALEDSSSDVNFESDSELVTSTEIEVVVSVGGVGREGELKVAQKTSDLLTLSFDGDGVVEYSLPESMALVVADVSISLGGVGRELELKASQKISSAGNGVVSSLEDIEVVESSEIFFSDSSRGWGKEGE